MVKENTPNIILMDFNMASLSGLEATKQILMLTPESKIIGVSMHSQPAYAIKMLQAGAKGYVTKNSHKDEIITPILEVNNGNNFICREIKNNMSGQDLENTPAADET